MPKNTTFVVEFIPTPDRKSFKIESGRILSEEPISVRQSNAASQIMQSIAAILAKNGFNYKDPRDEEIVRLRDELKETKEGLTAAAKAYYHALEEAVKGDLSEALEITGHEEEKEQPCEDGTPESAPAEQGTEQPPEVASDADSNVDTEETPVTAEQ